MCYYFPKVYEIRKIDFPVTKVMENKVAKATKMIKTKVAAKWNINYNCCSITAISTKEKSKF